MKLQEYQAKRIFGQYGVPVPSGDVATTPAEARALAERIGGTVVIKSQVLVGGRGKAGGIKLAKIASRGGRGRRTDPRHGYQGLDREEGAGRSRLPISARRSIWAWCSIARDAAWW